MMSSKSTQKSKKLSVPRELAEIEKEYQQHVFAAGQLQYQVSVYSNELKNADERLRILNNEAAARKQLNSVKAAAEQAPAQQDPTSGAV